MGNGTLLYLPCVREEQVFHRPGDYVADAGITRHFLLMTAMPHNGKEDFILALVEVEGDYAADPRYVRRPFDREPGFTEVSANHDLKKLLATSELPS